MPISGSDQGNPATPGSPGQSPEAGPQTPGTTAGPASVTPPPPPPKVALAPAKDRPSHGNVILVSRYAELAPLASRIGATLYLTNAWYRKRGLNSGICSLADTLQDALRNRPAAVIFDHTGGPEEPLGKVADGLRARGFPVWGAGEVNDLLENNRAFGLQWALRCGLNVPRTLFFDQGRGEPWTTVNLAGKQRIFRVKGHLDEAKAFVAAAGGKWVVKFFDTSAASTTFVAKSAEEMAWRLDHLQETGELKANQRFLLQQYVAGVEFSTEVIVSNGEIVGPPNGTLETKKMMAGDVGPNTGCMTSLVFVYENMKAQIVRRTLGREEVKAWLKAPTGPGGKTFPPYSAMLDVNCVVGDEDHEAWFLEATPRTGFNAAFAHMALMDGDLRKIFTDLAHGKAPEFKYRTGEFGYAMRGYIPPAPFADAYIPPKGADNWAFAERLLEPARHVHIGGPVDDPNVWLTDAQTDPGGGVRTAGVDGAVMEITARDSDIEMCADRATSLFKDIDLPDAFARVGQDGVKRAGEDTQRLLRFGYEVPGVELERPEPDRDIPKDPPLRPLVSVVMERKSA